MIIPVLGPFLEMLFLILLSVSIVGVIVCSLDDAWIDWMTLLHRLGPEEISPKELKEIRAIPEKKIGIIVANWHEEDVLRQMVVGNLEQIEYSNYSFFLGVYPNDQTTWKIAAELESQYSNVHVVVNQLPGPTSKGQMLNEIIRHVSAYNTKQLELSDSHKRSPFELILMQDSEDIIHPLALKLANREADFFDFVQFPVFSFERASGDLIGGTYFDEFAEVHLRDLLVRRMVGASIPSAGVATSIRVDLIERILSSQGSVFMDASLTEDYVLGLSVEKWGGKSSFCCRFIRDQKHNRDFIGTREFFPSQFMASIKQKTRWTIGIVFQSSDLLSGEFHRLLKHKPSLFFFLRDKKGLLSGFTFFANLFVLFMAIGFPSLSHDYSSIVLQVSIGILLWRVLRTFWYSAYLGGWRQGLLSLPRLPVRGLINSLAAVRACYQYLGSAQGQKVLKWEKTRHLMPEGFGSTAPAEKPYEVVG